MFAASGDRIALKLLDFLFSTLRNVSQTITKAQVREGALWVWDNSARGGQHKALPVEKTCHSLLLMPRFELNTTGYSIDKGMYENPFTLCSRGRLPPNWVPVPLRQPVFQFRNSWSVPEQFCLFRNKNYR